ncbi:MAG: hypothetical protein R6T89_06755 [Candidatus Syntrophosphaera sp.]
MSKQLYYRMSKIRTRPPLFPTGVTPGVSGSDITVDWSAVPTADSYNVYTSIDGGTWTLLDNEATTSYTFTPTTPGEYNFRVTSVRGTQESSPSAETLYDEMMEQVYSDTITGLRISAVDGTAFVDAAADITTYADGNHLLEIEDSLGNIASGVLSAQGSGETLGSEEILAVYEKEGMEYDSFVLNANGRDIDSAISTTETGLAFTDYDSSRLNKLFKVSTNLTLNSGNTPSLYFNRSNSGAVNGSIYNQVPTGAAEIYVTFKSSVQIRKCLLNSATGATWWLWLRTARGFWVMGTAEWPGVLALWKARRC